MSGQQLSHDVSPVPRTGFPNTPSGAEPPRRLPVQRPQRWWTAAVAAVAAVLIAIAGGIAYTNHQTAAQWRDRFAAAEADIDALEDMLEGRDAELERVTAALEASERDVAELEARVAEFANEKARVEDEREEITAVAERLVEISLAYDEVASQFGTCVSEQSAFTDMIIDFDRYWYTNQFHVVQQQAVRTDQVCNTAQGMLRDLRGYIDALAG